LTRNRLTVSVLHLADLFHSGQTYRSEKKPFTQPAHVAIQIGYARGAAGTEPQRLNGNRRLLHTRQIIRQEEAAKSFEQLWSDAAQAEELGFDHLWLGDSVTVLDKARGDCLTTMAALAGPDEQD
jgi:hypothetical protein